MAKKKKAAPRKRRQIVNPETGDKLVLKAYEQYPDEFRHLSKMMYITGRAGVAEIAKQLRIPKGTLETWRRRDKWVVLRRQVQRLANRDAVKVARKSMSIYVKEIDRGLNTMLETLHTRMDNLKDENKIQSEAILIKAILDIYRQKIQLVRTLTYGVQGKAFTPHPTNMMFDGTEEQVVKNPPKLFTNNAVEDILQVIPLYMQDAAKLILAGGGPEEWQDEVLDAVVEYLDAQNDMEDNVEALEEADNVVTNMLDMEEEDE